MQFTDCSVCGNTILEKKSRQNIAERLLMWHENLLVNLSPTVPVMEMQTSDLLLSSREALSSGWKMVAAMIPFLVGSAGLAYHSRWGCMK
jgi:hypothetical protein